MDRTRRCVFWYESRGETVSLQYVDGYLIEWPQGVDGISVSFSEGRTPDGVGSPSWEEQVPARPVTIDGYVVTRPADKRVRALLKIFAAGTQGRLYAKDLDDRIWWLGCKVQATPSIEGRTSLPRFQVQLRADYPYWQSQEVNMLSIPLGGTVQAEIGGDEPVLYRMTVTVQSGAAESVTLRDNGSGAVMQYAGQVGTGQTLRLEVNASGRISCTLNGSSVINAVTGGLRKIPAGARTLSVSVDGSAAGTAVIEYQEALSGV